MPMVSVRAALITPAQIQNVATMTAALLLGALFTAAFPEIVAASAAWTATVAPVVGSTLSAVALPPFQWLVTR